MKSAVLFATLAISLGSNAWAGDDIAGDRFFVSPTAGTLGVGIQASYQLNEQWRVRADVTAFQGAFFHKASRADINANLKLLSGGLTFDYFPTAGNFYLSGGARLSASRLNGSLSNLRARSSFGSLLIEDPLTSFSIRQNAMQPYIGAGYSVSLGQKASLNLDLGALYTGSPDLSVNSRATRFGFTRDQIDREIRRQQERISGFTFTPVVQIGLKFSF